MKRLGSSESLGALMAICPTTDEHSPRNNHVYSREFQTMFDGLDEEGCVEESGQIVEKKRRLSVDQVKALEKNFEVENKLEPERKVKLAQELGLQPRQVAVWFQNRRARWKTKQLERDYGILKASYETLKLNYDAIQHDNEALLKEIRELKSKLNEEKTESNLSVKEELVVSESDEKVKVMEQSETAMGAGVGGSDAKDLSNDDSFKDGNGGGRVSVFPDMKDGSSDSDSSAILNEDNSPNAAISSSGVLQNNHHHHLLMSPPSSSLRFNSSSSSSINCFHFSDSSRPTLGNTQKAYQPQFVKMEEHNFFGADESCNFFSDDQPPTLPWYCPDQWT